MKPQKTNKDIALRMMRDETEMESSVGVQNDNRLHIVLAPTADIFNQWRHRNSNQRCRFVDRLELVQGIGGDIVVVDLGTPRNQAALDRQREAREYLFAIKVAGKGEMDVS